MLLAVPVSAGPGVSEAPFNFHVRGAELGGEAALLQRVWMLQNLSGPYEEKSLCDCFISGSCS